MKVTKRSRPPTPSAWRTVKGHRGGQLRQKDGTVQQPDTRFDDVAKSAWYYKAVEYVAGERDHVRVSAREFAPNAGFSRAMLAQTLCAMSGKPAVKAESTFADVAANAWYADAVNWAAEKGYVSGVGDGKFAPTPP